MNTSKRSKKISSREMSDWHRADIIAALHKKGWSLRQLAIRHGYKTPSALGNALECSYPKAEKIIAAAIGVPPEIIWPSRFEKRNFIPAMPMISHKERFAA
jgi:Ner family transcriptional regulator